MLVNGFYVSFEFFSNLVLHLPRSQFASPLLTIKSDSGARAIDDESKQQTLRGQLQAKAATTAHWARHRITTTTTAKKKTNQHNERGRRIKACDCSKMIISCLYGCILQLREVPQISSQARNFQR